MARRTAAEVQSIREAIYDYCEMHEPITVRQLFYALVCQGLIDKTENEYKQTVCRLTKDMRLSGALPWQWLVDNTRWTRKPVSYGSLAECVERSASLYRRSLWQDSPDYVEVWLEKDALSGVMYEITSEYDCPLMVTRGYPSLSYLRSAAESMVATGKRVTVYYFGDFDPSGMDISRNIPERLNQFMAEIAFDQDVLPPCLTFDRVAINDWQIDAWELPTRPTKSTDSRASSFGHRSVEVDAIPPDQLRILVRHCLGRHISDEQLQASKKSDELERQTLAAMAGKLRAA